MEIKAYGTSEQVDPAVDLKVLSQPLPDILNLEGLIQTAGPTPPLIIEGILHQGCKMVVSGGSKSNKSWGLLDLVVSVASGQKWWGRQCAKMPVLYINFELHAWAVAQRLNALCSARPECTGLAKNLHVWNLRGHNADLTLLRPKLEERIAQYQFGLIILDPAYKVLGDRDENANGEIAGLMNELEALAMSSGAAVVLAHHYAKGDSTSKNAIDRMSGAGAWARDPDSLLMMTPHEEEDCFTVTPILRNLPRHNEFVVEWDFPLMRPVPDLDPNSLRRPKSKTCTDRDFIEKVLGDKPRTYSFVISEAQASLGMSKSTASRYLRRLEQAGSIHRSAGYYFSTTNHQVSGVTTL